jgi:hypothetical protein
LIVICEQLLIVRERRESALKLLKIAAWFEPSGRPVLIGRMLHIVLDIEPKRAHGRNSRCALGRDRPQSTKLIFAPPTSGFGGDP